MVKKTTIDMLTQDNVSIKKQNYVVQEGEEYAIGDTWRKAYANTLKGRIALQEEMSVAIVGEVYIVWGNIPTMEEVPETEVDNSIQPPNIEERIAALEEVLMMII